MQNPCVRRSTAHRDASTNSACDSDATETTEANAEKDRQRKAKVVTGVDDHSRYCVIASVVERATGRAVCAAFARALQRFGVPQEVLTDNGKQFTDRFGHGGEVLFDRICRENGIAHRLTQTASPTTTGKVERFHQTLRRELLDDCGAFESIGAAQAALDAWVEEYDRERARPRELAVFRSAFFGADEGVVLASHRDFSITNERAPPSLLGERGSECGRRVAFS